MNATQTISDIGTGVTQSTQNAIGSGLGLLGVLCFVFLLSFFLRKL